MEDRPVYPGHPITIAHEIVKRYPSLEAASASASVFKFPAALGNNDIPGAGGRVYAALGLLQRRAGGESWDSLFAWADGIWESEKFSRHKEGRQQALERREELMRLCRSWEEKSEVSEEGVGDEQDQP
jgi:hypothetical protein